MNKYRIKEASKLLGISTSKIRYLDNQNLLLKPIERDLNSGYRMLDREDIKYLINYLNLRDLDFSPIESKNFLLTCGENKEQEVFKLIEKRRIELEKVIVETKNKMNLLNNLKEKE